MSKKSFIICAVAIIMVVIISLLGNIITIADKASEIHPYVGYGFYIVLGLFVLRFILWPTLRFLFTPAMQGEQRDKLDEMEQGELARYISRMKLTQEEKELYAEGATPLEGVKNVLIHRDDKAKKVVRQAALNVFIVTGISQNGSLDIITALGINLQMINRVVGLRHSRPTLAQLFELYVVIISSALIISITDNILDEIDTSEIFGSVAGGLAKTLISSSINGAMNAYLTLRIGKLTMRYLEMGSKRFKQERKKIRREARKSAIKELPLIAKQGLESVAGAVKVSATERLSDLNPFKKKLKEEIE
jgi:hypothetical protein